MTEAGATSAWRRRARACGRRRRGSGRLLVAPLLSFWIIGALCVKDVPVAQVVALVGEPTYLPCDITPSEENDEIHLILWFREGRDGTSAAIYSVDARDREFNFAERWSDEKVFSNRAHFVQDRQPAELGVDHIREEDAGIYRCRVEFRLSQTRNSRVNLTVIVPPHKITILNENGVVQRSSVGPYREGDDLRLLCEVHGGKPTPTIGWYRNGRPLSNESISDQREGVVRAEVALKNLGRKDVQTELSCNATNNNRSQPLSSSVRLDMHFSPLTVNIEGANRRLSAGKRHDLVCTTSGSRPPALVTWLMEEQKLPYSKDTTTPDGNTTTSVLSFTASKEDEGKRLFCRVQNTIIRSSPIEDVWLLEIQYKPETKIRLGTSLDPNAIKEGSDVYFDCLIQARPPVYKVEWTHQGKTLNHNISRGVIISNQSLVLQGVDRKNAGNYTCVGYNTEGDGQSEPFYLNVMFAPTCKPNQTKVHGVAKQEKASISCEVDANPPEVDFRWTFNNSADSVDLDRSHVSTTGTSSVASYMPTIELDYGTLLCWARNRIGTQQIPCIYHIIPAGRPDVPHNCSTSNMSKNSFVIRCSPGFDGGLTQSFMLEVRESNSQELKTNLTAEVPFFSVSNLDAGSIYQACVYAYNDKGRSEPMVVQVNTLSLPEKQLTSDSERPRPHMRLTPMLSVMIGVVAALVIVAVIVMIVLRIQHSQVDEQSKSQVEDSTKPAKNVPIQRELRFRECGSLITDEKNPDASPFGKLDTISAGDVSESDEKNPDIIPQQITEFTFSTGEEVSEYLRKRRLVSTIETSPSRGLLERSAVAAAVGSRGNYVGYCTIRSSMPLRELSNTVKFKHKSQFQQPMTSEVYESGMCTLPRQHWSSHGATASTAAMAMSMSPSVMYTAGGNGSVNVVRTGPGGVLLAKDIQSSAAAQCCIQQASPSEMHEVATSVGKIGTPILVTKRESSV
ncbi:nephrin isoform X1 [Nasonia vitripennis]|uniref:Sidestep protein n=1 Tax=Nasonia vitripennis TaxID=7425 RepID=A0A7M7M263_NASVI|nr:nephrin isoform X1 [Nasonia vitripennis]